MLLEEARFVIETHVSYSEEAGPAEGGRVGFAIGDRVFWTDAYFNDSKLIFEAKRTYAEAVVAAINSGRFDVPAPPEWPARPDAAPIDALPPDWMRWDGKAPPELYGSWITVRVMFKDRTEQPLTQDFDWMADRGDNPIIAWFDEIPF